MTDCFLCYNGFMPGYWDEIIGHKPVVKLLDLWVEHPAFSYLFYGPAHLGKSAVAEKFVRALVGETDLKDLNLHPDIVMFLPEEGKKDISVEQVRKNRLRLYERPQIAQRVVAFLPKLDRLNETGFNALLKVMEEPPADAVFISVAENLARLPSTIVSRTVCVPFGLVSQKEIQAGLELKGMEPEEAKRRAGESRGRPGLAIEEDQSKEAFMEAANQYALGPTVGHRLAASEKLRQACESSEDTSSAWTSALEACMLALRQDFLKRTRETLILGQGIADAMASINGPVQPRFLLDAAALQVSRNFLLMPNLYPRYFPLSLTV
jgi:hypothetical protein